MPNVPTNRVFRQTFATRLLVLVGNRSARAENRPTPFAGLFAARVAQSYPVWPVFCAVAGWIGSPVGPPAGIWRLTALAVMANVAILPLSPSGDLVASVQGHPVLRAGRHHTSAHASRHSALAGDDVNRRWPIRHH